ncbi:MAG: site-specific DNA-methyltransferase [Prevotellaceae bacterium]|jgi:site-specific DNA-methyltransferase (adenine-specific)|nr:site-specific DNA-methyltransferase [Prevotellaceae bacterium]
MNKDVEYEIEIAEDGTNMEDILLGIVTNSELQNINPAYKTDDNVLYNADCMDIMTMLPDNCVDLIFADPPYNLSNDGITCHAGKMVSVNKGTWDKSKGFDEDLEFHETWIKECKRILKPEGTIWISGTNHSIYQCGFLLQKLGFHILNDIAWFKPNAAPNLACTTFAHSHETLLWAKKEKKAKHIFNYDAMKNGYFTEDKMKIPDKQMRTVWSIPTPAQSEKEFGKHPTQKPLALLKRIILASTNEGCLILDPFNGGGTTAVAAKMIGNRKYIGIDIDENFINLTKKRLNQITEQYKIF